ncbi:transposase subunit [Mycobacteroides abscessus subsp. abscessus]|nr:transposase subunit [Mycobacteroides abscessus subsp. abscessus]
MGPCPHRSSSTLTVARSTPWDKIRLAHQARCQARSRRLDRTDLQPPTKALQDRHDQPNRLRAPPSSDGTSRLTPCPPSGGNLTLCLCAIKDVFSNRIIGYSIDSRRGDVGGCILYPDRGSQFRSRKFVHNLHRHVTVGSMDRVGTAGDNAAMERFSTSHAEEATVVTAKPPGIRALRTITAHARNANTYPSRAPTKVRNGPESSRGSLGKPSSFSPTIFRCT